ncbi:cytochrome P450 93A3-like [Neltuma alba]|uniref:cytochrome P450 93A3-like n=1 Tax=Neltuma alba TaxID=207710 RepID=UPI0010A394ED|nr:cytochrome P450 93A3-like [Prosopis alba]
MADSSDFQFYIQAFFIWLLSTILVRTIILKTKQKKKAHLPPTPFSLPIIGHLHLLSSLPHRDFYNLSLRYGPIIHLFLGSEPCVVVSTAETAKEFLKTHELSFSNRPSRTVAIKHLTYELQDFLFAPYGPYWKFMKKMCMSELLNGRMLDRFLLVREQEKKRFLNTLLQKGGEKVDVGAELIELSNNIISRMAVSRTSSENEDDADVVRKLVVDAAELTGKFNISDFISFCRILDLQGFNKRLKEVRERFDKLMERIIEEHQEERTKRKEMGIRGDEAGDILDVLLDIYEDENPEKKLTKENIKAFIFDIFVAGTDTTAITIEWALAELINHPHVMEKARQEIDSVIGNNRIVRESDIAKLPYLQAIVKEALRIHPAGPLLFRESSRSSVVCGYEIAEKTRLFINVWAIGRDPNHWKNPDEFRPERFMSEDGNGESQLDVRGQHFQYIPFGSGRRGCPGTSLALQVVQTNLAAMIQCFEWKVDGKISMEEKAGITVPRAHPLVCVPLPRLHPFPSMSF